MNILVRVPNWIGDAVMCLPALMDLRNHDPHARVTVLARPIIGDLLRGHPGVDEVIMYFHQGEHKGLLGLWHLIQLVKGKQFDRAVLFQNAFEAALITWVAGIPFRIGYATDGRRWLLSEAVPWPDRAHLHHTEYYQEIVKAVTHSSGKDRTPQLFLSPEVKNACAKEFPEVFLPSDSLVIGMNPGSVYGSAKRWLPERFAEVGDLLVERLTKDFPGTPSVRCVLIGGKGEEALGEDIAKRMRYEPIVLSGRTTIPELMGVLTRCSVLVTNDTGPMHVAQALGVPVAAVFGSTDSSTTSPHGQSRGVVTASVRCAPCLLRACPIDHRCMTQVSVEQVVEAALSQIRMSPGYGNEGRIRGHVG
ncbi:lipopolysaccharide heptosyltransferase II [uncultured Nitrospira sp.]|uniref:lipopolysaccharide heptosyltransferase II n=1 Tax=uncultured Nitrospira sp. TaxID=157176 RepID=UPI003140AA0F